MSAPELNISTTKRGCLPSLDPGIWRQMLFLLGGGCLLIALASYNTAPSYRHLKWIAGIIWFAATTPPVLIRKKLPKSTVWTLAVLLGWIVYPCILTPMASSTALHLKSAGISVFYTLFCCSVLFYMMKTPATFFLYLFWAGLLWTCGNGILLVLHLNQCNIIPYESRFFAGVYTNRNNFAVASMTLFALLLFYRHWLSGQLLKWSVFVLAGLATLAIITLSLKALVGVPLLLILFFLYSPRIRCKTKCFYLLILILSVSLFLTINKSYQYRIQRFYLHFTDPSSLKSGESAEERFWFLQESGRLIRNHLLTGVGLDNSRLFLISDYRQKLIDLGRSETGGSSHNNYAEMLLNGGVPCFILYYAPLLYLLFVIRKNRDATGFCRSILVFKMIMDFAMISYNALPSVLLLGAAVLIYFGKYNNVPHQTSVSCVRPETMRPNQSAL